MFKNGSSWSDIECDQLANISELTTIFRVAKLKRFAILTFKSQKIVSLNSGTIEGGSSSV